MALSATVWLIGAVAMVLLSRWLLGQMRGNAGYNARSWETPLERLEKLYVHGDISPEEFVERRKALLERQTTQEDRPDFTQREEWWLRP